MFNIIVSGHGKFASGLENLVSLIIGQQDNIAFVDFNSTTDATTFSQTLKMAKEKLKGDNTLVLTDIVGGTPFNAGVLLGSSVKVIGGTNVTLLFEAIEDKDSSNLEDVIASLISRGKEAIVFFEHKKVTITNDEGI